MPRKGNACKQGRGYAISHKDAARQHARLREIVAVSAAEDRAKQAAEDERISAMLRADTEHLRPARKTPA